MKSLSNGISTVEKYVAMILMLFLAFIVAIAVFFRYLLNAPLSWAGELSVFLMIWISFIGGSLGLKTKSQAAVTLLIEYFPVKARRLTEIGGHILMLLFLGLILYYSYFWIFSPGVAYQKSSAMLLPMWIPFSAVPIGLTCAAIHLLTNLVEIVRGEEIQ